MCQVNFNIKLNSVTNYLLNISRAQLGSITLKSNELRPLRIDKCFNMFWTGVSGLLTCVVAGYINPHGRALSLARPSLLRRTGAVAVEVR